MKKTILKIALCAGILFSVSSCREELIDSYAPGALTEETAIKTIDDLELLLNSGYARINSRGESVNVSVFTDEVGIGNDNGGNGLSGNYIFNVLPSSGFPSTIWNTSYLALARINRVLESSDKFNPSESTEINKLKMLKAEALTLRAYLHLRILGYYTEDMTNDSALAGVLANKVFTVEEASQNVRVTNADFYTQIHADLDQAIALYNTIPGYTLDKIKANKFFAMGLKARAYSYKGDYTNAETWADNVINQSGLVVATPIEYVKTFFQDSEAANSEVIFRLQRTPQQNSQGYNLHNGWCSIRPRLDGSQIFEVSRALFNKLSPSDVRRLAIVAPTSIIDPSYASSENYMATDILVINKHGGTLPNNPEETAAVTQNGGFHNSIKVMRLSEMYYIKAEAQAATSPSDAATTIDVVRQARELGTFTPSNFTTPQDAWAGILADKRIEFAYEGYRFLDLKRLGAKAGVGVDRDEMDYVQNPGGNPSNLPLGSYKWALPVPQAELNANSSIQQNPGY